MISKLKLYPGRRNIVSFVSPRQAGLSRALKKELKANNRKRKKNKDWA